MADTVLPTGPSAHGDKADGKVLTPIKWTLRVGLVVVAAYAVMSVYQLREAYLSEDTTATAAYHSMGLVDPTPKGLASQFTDVQGRMLADPPSDATLLQDPQTLVLAHINSDEKDPESPEISWPEFETYLSKTTGRAVTDMTFDNSPEQLATIKDNAITLVALHAADVPYLVNNFGFQPVAVLGNDGGANGNKLDIIVPANSDITTAGLLKGHTLTCTVPSSITGYRAAVALLMELNGLRPNMDYLIDWSLKQKTSIVGIAKNKYAAAAVSDDSLQSHLRSGTVADSQYKIIYQSDVIPRTTIGYFYNLKPDLAATLQTAIKAYVVGDPADPDTKPLRFLPVDYKKDFQLVREIDDRFDPRFDSTPKKLAAASTTQPATQP